MLRFGAGGAPTGGRAGKEKVPLRLALGAAGADRQVVQGAGRAVAAAAVPAAGWLAVAGWNDSRGAGALGPVVAPWPVLTAPQQC
jgi:hypothetical protein